MRERQLYLLISPAFLLALGVLLANDFLLKPQFHNAITGKMSDVVGLFAFALFWSAIFPRFRTHVIVLIAVAFVFWKSPYSQVLIEGWNRVAPFAVSRTVDGTDLLALLVLPLAHLYGTRARSQQIRRPLIYLVAAVSLFAFVATSSRKDTTTFDQTYFFSFKKQEFLQRMSGLPNEPSNQIVRSGDFFRVKFDDCIEDAWIGVTEAEGKTKVRLFAITSRCSDSNETADRHKLTIFFETNFIKPLEATEVRPVSKLQTIRDVKYAEVPGSENRPVQ